MNLWNRLNSRLLARPDRLSHSRLLARPDLQVCYYLGPRNPAQCQEQSQQYPEGN